MCYLAKTFIFIKSKLGCPGLYFLKIFTSVLAILYGIKTCVTLKNFFFKNAQNFEIYQWNFIGVTHAFALYKITKTLATIFEQNFCHKCSSCQNLSVEFFGDTHVLALYKKAKILFQTKFLSKIIRILKCINKIFRGVTHVLML